MYSFSAACRQSWAQLCQWKQLYNCASEDSFTIVPMKTALQLCPWKQFYNRAGKNSFTTVPVKTASQLCPWKQLYNCASENGFIIVPMKTGLQLCLWKQLYNCACENSFTTVPAKTALQLCLRKQLYNRQSSAIQGTALGKSLCAWTCIYRSMPAGVAQSRHTLVGGTVSTWGRWRIPVNKRQKRHQKCQTLTARGEHADRIVGSPSW